MTPLLIAAPLLFSAAPDDAADWPGFRGPASRSVAAAADPPTEFDGPAGTNVAWSAPLPGGGFSGPAVAGGRVFVTAASGYASDRLHVLAFDETTGERAWERTFAATGRTGTYEPDMRVATSAPAADGRRVYAQFSSNDVVCLTHDGVPVWYRGLTADYPNASNSLGMSSSPLLATAADGSRTLIVMAENDAQSLLFGLDPDTGVSRWVLDRPAKANWSSPALLPDGSAFGNDGDLVLCQGSYGLDAIDPATGAVEWRWGEGASTIASPTAADGLILAVADGITALRPDGPGRVAVAWTNNRLRPGYASPVAFELAGGEGFAATVTQGGILNVAALADGEEVGKARMPSDYWATPVAVGTGLDTRLFCPSRNGEVAVIGFASGGAPDLLAVNRLGKEPMWASPAVAGDAVFFRSDSTLWKVAAE